MKTSFKNFKQLKDYIDNGDSNKVLQSADIHSVSIEEDATDVFINAQREIQEVEKPPVRPDSVNDIESLYMWLSKGG